MKREEIDVDIDQYGSKEKRRKCGSILFM